MGRAAQKRRPEVPVSCSLLPATPGGTPDAAREQADQPDEGNDGGHDEEPVDDETGAERDDRENREYE
jgi:hypothetical protein